MDYYNKIISISLNLLQIYGSNPTKPLRIVLVLCFLAAITFVLGLVYAQFFYEEINIKLLSDVLESTLILLHGTAKLLPFVLKRKQAYNLIKNVEKFWNYADPIPEKQAENLRTLKLTDKLLRSFCGLGYLATVMFMIRPYFNHVLPIVCYVPEFMPFTFISLFTGVTAASLGLVSLGFDCFSCGLILMLYLQFKILNNRIASINLQDAENPQCRDQIKECVDYHNFLFLFLDDFNRFIQEAFLVQFCLTTGTTCFEMLIISKNSQDFTEVSKSLVYLIVLLVQITLLYCWPSHLVKLEASRIILTVYESEWTSCPNISMRKELILIMQRTQKEAVISAGKMFVVDLETCTSIFKTTLSFYTFFNTMQQN